MSLLKRQISLIIGPYKKPVLVLILRLYVLCHYLDKDRQWIARGQLSTEEKRIGYLFLLYCH